MQIKQLNDNIRPCEEQFEHAYTHMKRSGLLAVKQAELASKQFRQLLMTRSALGKLERKRWSSERVSEKARQI
jgi:hypothetical protein